MSRLLESDRIHNLPVKIIYHIHPSYSSDIGYPRSSVTYTNSPLSCFVHSSSTSSDLATTPGLSKGIGRKRKRSEAGENYESRTNGEGRARGSEKRNEGKDEGERRASLYLKDVMLRIIETSPELTSTVSQSKLTTTTDYTIYTPTTPTNPYPPPTLSLTNHSPYSPHQALHPGYPPLQLARTTPGFPNERLYSTPGLTYTYSSSSSGGGSGMSVSSASGVLSSRVRQAQDQGQGWNSSPHHQHHHHQNHYAHRQPPFLLPHPNHPYNNKHPPAISSSSPSYLPISMLLNPYLPHPCASTLPYLRPPISKPVLESKGLLSTFASSSSFSSVEGVGRRSRSNNEISHHETLIRGRLVWSQDFVTINEEGTKKGGKQGVHRCATKSTRKEAKVKVKAQTRKARIDKSNDILSKSLGGLAALVAEEGDSDSESGSDSDSESDCVSSAEEDELDLKGGTGGGGGAERGGAWGVEVVIVLKGFQRVLGESVVGMVKPKLEEGFNEGGYAEFADRDEDDSEREVGTGCKIGESLSVGKEMGKEKEGLMRDQILPIKRQAKVFVFHEQTAASAKPSGNLPVHETSHPVSQLPTASNNTVAVKKPSANSKSQKENQPNKPAPGKKTSNGQQGTGKSRKVMSIKSGPGFVCSNCGRTESCTWRQKNNERVCNACGIYWNAKREMRPKELWGKPMHAWKRKKPHPSRNGISTSAASPALEDFTMFDSVAIRHGSITSSNALDLSYFLNLAPEQSTQAQSRTKRARFEDRIAPPPGMLTSRSATTSGFRRTLSRAAEAEAEKREQRRRMMKTVDGNAIKALSDGEKEGKPALWSGTGISNGASGLKPQGQHHQSSNQASMSLDLPLSDDSGNSLLHTLAQVYDPALQALTAPGGSSDFLAVPADKASSSKLLTAQPSFDFNALMDWDKEVEGGLEGLFSLGLSQGQGQESGVPGGSQEAVVVEDLDANGMTSPTNGIMGMSDWIGEADNEHDQQPVHGLSELEALLARLPQDQLDFLRDFDHTSDWVEPFQNLQDPNQSVEALHSVAATYSEDDQNQNDAEDDQSTEPSPFDFSQLPPSSPPLLLEDQKRGLSHSALLLSSPGTSPEDEFGIAGSYGDMASGSGSDFGVDADMKDYEQLYGDL